MFFENEHIPVMPNKVIEFLNPKEGGVYLDATLGGGGHTALIAKFLGKNGKIIVIDQDIEAIKKAQARLSQYKNKIFYFHDNFKNIENIFYQAGIKKINGALFDLGVSTYQLKTPERGFSFSEKPENLNKNLDMRMNRSQKLTAFIVINEYQEKKLEQIFLNFGEESYSCAKKIAQNIVLKRKIKPIKTVNDLLEIIKTSFPSRHRFKKNKNHYAGNVFRAIRMEVNQELFVLKEALPKAINFLEKNGRLVVISFHSLEDRIVKQTFKKLAAEKKIKILTQKPIMADSVEIKKNPASDSAKLRAVEKV